MKAATSPVCAPSSTWVEQFCPATCTFEPSRRSATVLIAVKTGAMTTSQWFAFATRGLSASAVSTAAPSVLYIFQLPAITGLRIRDSFVSQRGDAGEFFAGEKFQCGAAAG